MHREHGKKTANVDYPITFSQNRTELEENLFNRSNSSEYVTLSRTSVNQLSAELASTCPLCNKTKHKFVDGKKFIIYNPQQRTDASHETTKN